MTIRRGDDTNAFGFGFLVINLANPEEYVVTKAEVRIGPISKFFINPIFPIRISLNRLETEKLKETNMCYMAIYDKDGLKYTCEGSLEFPTKPKVV